MRKDVKLGLLADSAVSEMFTQAISPSEKVKANHEEFVKKRDAKAEIQQRFETSGTIQARNGLNLPSTGIPPAVAFLGIAEAFLAEGYLVEELMKIQGKS